MPNRLQNTLAAVLGFAAACAAPAPYDLAILGATVIDGTGGAAQPNRLILIRHGRIAEISDAAASRGFDAVEVIDARDQFVTPGLADVHVHFGSGGLGPRRPDATERALDHFVRYGVTTVLNVGATGGSTQQVRALREQQAAGIVAPLRIYATGDMLTIPGSHPIATIMTLPEGVDAETYDWSQRGIAVVSEIEQARSVVERNLAAGMDAIKIIVESGPTEFGVHPQMSLAMIEAIVETADACGGFVVAHVSSLDELEDCVTAGVRAILHAVSEPPFPSDQHWRAMRDKGIYYVPTLSLYGSLLSTLWNDPSVADDPFLTDTVEASTRASVAGFAAPFGDASAAEEWRAILHSVKAAYDAGVPMALGTDTNNPRVFPGYSAHRELETLVELGIPAAAALEIATRRPAELLGRATDFGTVEVGKYADLLILDANPLDDIRNTRTVRQVVIDGRVAHTNRPE